MVLLRLHEICLCRFVTVAFSGTVTSPEDTVDRRFDSMIMAADMRNSFAQQQMRSMERRAETDLMDYYFYRMMRGILRE